MKVETLLDMKQVGFFMHENKVVCGAVEKIVIIVGPHLESKIEYVVSINVKERPIVVEEGKLYTTKADLLSSL